MEGFAASYFVPDQWFTVTVDVKDLTTSSKLQFNKTPEGNLNIYLDNVRYYLPGFTSIEKEFDLGMFAPQNESLYLMSLNSDSAFVSEGSYSIKFSSDSRWPRYYFTQSFIDWLNDMGYARISFELYIDTANGTANVSMTEGIYATSAPDFNAWVRIDAAVADLSANSFIQINKDTTGTANFYVDNMKYYSAEPEHVKEPGVVLDFVTSKDTEDFTISAIISYNTVQEYTVNGIGSLKILCEGKWPELNFGSTFSAYSMENVEKVGFMVYVPSIPDGGYVRLGINDKEYQRITKAGEWVTIYVPASTITTATLEGIKVCISKHDGTGWCNVGVVYIGKMWLEYKQPVFEEKVGVIYDFANSSDVDGIVHANGVKGTIVEKDGSSVFKFAASGAWHKMHLSTDVDAKFTASDVDYIYMDVYFDVTLLDGESIRFSYYFLSGGSYAERFYDGYIKAKEWTTVKIPVMEGTEKLSDINFLFPIKKTAGWEGVGTTAGEALYIREIGVISNEESFVNFTGSESNADLGVFYTSNQDYRVALNTNPAFVKDGTSSIKLTAAPRWPGFYFTDAFKAWLTLNEYTKISFDIYIDSANAATTVTQIEGCVYSSAPVVDQWFSVTVTVSELTYLQFNKPAANSLDVYIDNIQFIK